MDGRIERLLNLVCAGSTTLVRSIILNQCSELVTSSPNLLPQLLSAFISALNSEKWDTRITASQCLDLLFLKASNDVCFTQQFSSLDDFSMVFQLTPTTLSSVPHLGTSETPGSSQAGHKRKRSSNLSSKKLHFHFSLDSEASLSDSLPELVANYFPFLSSPEWPIRHGSSLLLSSLVSALPNCFPQENLTSQLHELTVTCFRDRLKDFMGDQILYPTAEQNCKLLGLIISQFINTLPQNFLLNFVKLLLSFLKSEDSHFSIISLLIIRSLGPICENEILVIIFQSIYDLLSFSTMIDDELISIIGEIILSFSPEILLQIFTDFPLLQIFINMFTELDEISSAIFPLLQVINKLLIYSEFISLVFSSLPQLVPLLRHSLYSVRKQTLNTITTLVDKVITLQLSVSVGDQIESIYRNYLTAFVKVFPDVNSSFFDSSESLIDSDIDFDLLSRDVHFSKELISLSEKLPHALNFDSEFSKNFDLINFLSTIVFPLCSTSNSFSFKVDLLRVTFNLTSPCLLKKIKIESFLEGNLNDLNSIFNRCIFSCFLLTCTSSSPSKPLLSTYLPSIILPSLSPSISSLIDLQIQPLLQRVAGDLNLLVNKCKEEGIAGIVLNQSDLIASSKKLISSLSEAQNVSDEVRRFVNKLEVSLKTASDLFSLLTTRVSANLASVWVFCGEKSLPIKVGPIAKLFINHLSEEHDVILSNFIARNFAIFLIEVSSRSTAAHNVLLNNIFQGLFDPKSTEVKRRNYRLVIKHLMELNGDLIFDRFPLLFELLSPSTDHTSNDIFFLLKCYCCFFSVIGSTLQLKLLNNFLQILVFVSLFLDNFITSQPKDSDLFELVTSKPINTFVKLSTIILQESNQSFHQSFLIEAINLLKNPSTPSFFNSLYFLIFAEIFESNSTLFLFFVPSLLIQALSHVSSSAVVLRTCSNICFSKAFRLISLVSRDVLNFVDLNEKLSKMIDHDFNFLSELLDIRNFQLSKFDDTFQVKNGVQLRPYQREGIIWLNFLRKFKLHGILADDMGLGKTIQALFAVFFSFNEKSNPVASLIVCPSSLLNHWHRECLLVAPELNPIIISKSRVFSTKECAHNWLVITSYDVIRADCARFSSIKFDYVVLDEGHLIQNSNSQLFKSVKSLDGNHRLILTGTPIQNHVLDLWSLFDFLMPGFLGSKRIFGANFSRPILALRDSSSPKVVEKAAIALNNLHKQLLPFILRRQKSDVLKCLPPKIITDIYCSLTLEQKNLLAEIDTNTSLSKSARDNSELKIVSFPTLVDQLGPAFSYQHSGKMIALFDLLQQCGFSATDTAEQNIDNMGKRKILLFVQNSFTLTLIERLVLSFFHHLTYLRMDNSVLPADRQALVDKFNTNSDVDMFLLTTSVGSLGLNLQSADTVVMFEHSWNPQEDLQAMDRAHRIGQTRVVNVYRLIMLDSLEEKVMSYQQFKLHIANVVVSHENVSMSSMDTSTMLQTFGSSVRIDDKKKEIEMEFLH
ncbi:hypothetical protein RCL1_005384 [Eukaryota sp. TZLM3-RCL]